MTLLLDILWTFFKIGLFAYGGGYAAVALIISEVINTRHWITSTDFLQILTLAEMTPGPIAINTATFVGYQVAGLPGSAVATLGIILPSLILVTTAFHFYRKIENLAQIKSIMSAMRPAVLAILISAVISLAKPTLTSIISVAIFSIVLLASLRFKLNPLLLILLAGSAGLLANAL
ncbi:MAG: chromate transporter [bacterium]|jgi:chromate transporter|nr:chromate transporter [bacterium]MDD3804812.1 chromate transporter [bacterium]MDD4153426.1 chromate transporter [bacterium]MDD4558202.1 chromate transporter [bacterium]